MCWGGGVTDLSLMAACSWSLAPTRSPVRCSPEASTSMWLGSVEVCPGDSVGKTPSACCTQRRRVATPSAWLPSPAMISIWPSLLAVASASAGVHSHVLFLCRILKHLCRGVSLCSVSLRFV